MLSRFTSYVHFFSCIIQTPVITVQIGQGGCGGGVYRFRVFPCHAGAHDIVYRQREERAGHWHDVTRFKYRNTLFSGPTFQAVQGGRGGGVQHCVCQWAGDGGPVPRHAVAGLQLPS